MTFAHTHSRPVQVPCLLIFAVCITAARCRTPVTACWCRPFYDVIATDKWKAWAAQRGKTREAARTEFIKSVSAFLGPSGDDDDAAASYGSGDVERSISPLRTAGGLSVMDRVFSSDNLSALPPAPSSAVPAASVGDATVANGSPHAGSPALRVPRGSNASVHDSLTPAQASVPETRRSKSTNAVAGMDSGVPASPAPTPELVGRAGMLLKQRDIMKGWRERYFVLEGKLLSYYKQKTDTVPRGAVFLANVRGWKGGGWDVGVCVGVRQPCILFVGLVSARVVCACVERGTVVGRIGATLPVYV